MRNTLTWVKLESLSRSRPAISLAAGELLPNPRSRQRCRSAREKKMVEKGGVEGAFAKAVSELGRVAERLDPSQIAAFIEAVVRARRVFLIGAGREGLSTRAFAMRLTHLGLQAHWVWDDTTPAIAPG